MINKCDGALPTGDSISGGDILDNTKKLICIECPRGCELSVVLCGDTVTSVEGNFCAKGDAYARQELVNPTRIVTSTIRVGDEMVSVKTDKPVPKSLIFDVMKQINLIVAIAPIKIGDILLKNVCGTDSNIIASKNCYAKKSN